MPASRNYRPSADAQTAVVTAPNLKDAYRRVRREFGGNAVILGTRSLTRRQDGGLGRERVVEVIVQGPQGAGAAAAGRPGSGAPARPSVHRDADPGTGLMAEVARIEELAESIQEQVRACLPAAAEVLRDPAARLLLAAGVRPETVQRLVPRFAAEHGDPAAGPQELQAWLARQVRAANCAWEAFGGCHAFLGYAGADRSELALATAARMHALGRQTLLLVLFPEHAGQVRRLQTEAARHGYDAAVLQKESQLQRCESHLARYDVVLAELPDMERPLMQREGPIHRWLAPNPGFHRHLVAPLDSDPQDLPDLREESRHWNCDWLALTRTRRCRRPGKILDVVEGLPLPVSLLLAGGAGDEAPAVAHSQELAALALGRQAAAAQPAAAPRS